MSVINKEPADLETSLRLACKVQAQHEMLLEPEASSIIVTEQLGSKVYQLAAHVAQILSFQNQDGRMG